jgi:hypothetical protein
MNSPDLGTCVLERFRMFEVGENRYICGGAGAVRVSKVDIAI